MISCAKSKDSSPSAARDLYTSARFRKARAHAEASGAEWFILSAEHGLVAPDEWLAPYERYLPDTPKDYRVAWGAWVVARLELLLGSLHGRTIEIHAGEAYVQPLLPALTRRSAFVERPLAGLTSGRWQGWYDSQVGGASIDARSNLFADDPTDWIARLGDHTCSHSATELDRLERGVLDGPGLYSWFVDATGAADLSRGLGADIGEGLIYVGQTGAAKWPSGKPSASTLISRIRGQHLRGRRTASTLRLTLGSILDQSFGRECHARS
ncbi:MAG: hypothetical protein JWO11_894 [Nocardioides sp.]|nr:hypothetical protein [Nocardioides sp.]